MQRLTCDKMFRAPRLFVSLPFFGQMPQNSPATTSAVGGGLYLPPPPDNPDQYDLQGNPPGGPEPLNTTAVPEPVTGVMALLGLAGLTLTATRRRRR